MAVAVREWNTGVHPEFWQKQLAKALDGLIEKTGAKVVFIPFQKTSNEREDDVAVGQRVTSLMKSAASVTAIKESKEPEEIEALISQCDLVVGMRFHSIVFATRSAVPVVSLSYDPKVEALMDEIGLGYLNTRLDRIESRKLFGSMMTALEQRGEISALLIAACGDLAGRAKQTARLAKNLAEKKRHVPKKPLPDVLFKVSLGIQDQLAVIDQLEEQRRTLDARVVELAAWAQKQQEQIESLRSELSAKDSETAKLASRLHASSELLREADQAQLEARRDLEKHLAEVERDLAGARAQAQHDDAEAADLRNQAEETRRELADARALAQREASGAEDLRKKAEELQHWTSRQENHVKDLTAWVASQKVANRPADVRIDDGSPALGSAGASTRASHRRGGVPRQTGPSLQEPSPQRPLDRHGAPMASLGTRHRSRNDARVASEPNSAFLPEVVQAVLPGWKDGVRRLRSGNAFFAEPLQGLQLPLPAAVHPAIQPHGLRRFGLERGLVV